MDRNMRHSYSSSVGPRSLPHMMPNGGGKRHGHDARFADTRHGDVRHDVRHSGDVRNSPDARHDGRSPPEGRQDVRTLADVRSDTRHSDEWRQDTRQTDARHGGSGARLSPPFSEYNNNNTNQNDDLIHYIYESWNKVTREVERGSEDTKYYQEVVTPRQLANFRPFNLEEWWGRRLMLTIKRQQHRS